MRILVTGASGFVGRALCPLLAERGHQVIAAMRREVALLPGVTAVAAPELGPEADWRPALDGVEAVIHLAARAHVMDETEADPLAVFRRVNRDGTLRLAEQAAEAGVRRLVFVSSIKVNGEETPPGRPFTAEDQPAPRDAYGLAKAEAEAALAGIEVTILRPPLVHGPGAKGNLASLMKVLRAGLPLPLASIDNRRSLVGVANLADALAFVAEHPGAAGKTFLVRDGEDVSTPDLIRRLGAAMGLRPRLLPFPPTLLALAARALGREAAVRRLAGSLVVEDSPLRALGWVPPLTLDQGLRAMATEDQE